MSIARRLRNGLLVESNTIKYWIDRFGSGFNPVILMYHGVTRENNSVQESKHVNCTIFKEQLNLLKKCYQFIDLASLPDPLVSNKLDRPLIAVTFDDGFRNNYDVAAEILLELGIPATFFVSTWYIGRQRWIWTDLLEYAVMNSKSPVLKATSCTS